MTELRHEIATLLSEELPWPEAYNLAFRVLKLVAKPDIYPEHSFAKKCMEVWPGMRQGEITTLRLLLSKELVRHAEIFHAINTKSEQLDIVKVWVSYLRRHTGAHIQNVYGIGYSMPLDDREKLKSKIGELK
jgi:hypothetical protein